MRRIYDLPIAAQPGASFRRISLETFPTDSEKEGYTYSSKRSRLVDGIKRLSLVIANLRAIRDADLILCSEGDYFWILVLLRKVRLFNAKPIVWRIIFKSGSVSRVLPMMGSDANFRIGVVTKDQENLASNRLVCYNPWRIDLQWFTPGDPANDKKGHYFIPGNAYRDENFIKRLALEECDIRLIRCGRSSRLNEIYGDEVRDNRITLSINPCHSVYLELLRDSFCVLLPIMDCDEPAGLTALLEALACGIPVIARDSLGIRELAAQLPSMIRTLSTDDPRFWREAALTIARVSDSDRNKAIDFVRENYSLGDEGLEFWELLKYKT